MIGITCCGSERGCILSWIEVLNLFTCFIAECAAVNEPVRNNGSQVELLNGMGGDFLHNGMGFGFVKLNMRHVEALSVCEPNMLVEGFAAVRVTVAASPTVRLPSLIMYLP